MAFPVYYFWKRRKFAENFEVISIDDRNVFVGGIPFQKMTIDDICCLVTQIICIFKNKYDFGKYEEWN